MTATTVRAGHIVQTSPTAFTIDIRGHGLTVDQTVDDGGDDTAPNPLEVFVAGIASCAAYYAAKFLARKMSEPLHVDYSYEMAGPPNRIRRIDIVFTFPEGLDQSVIDGALRSAAHCTVHNTLSHKPEINLVAASTMNS